MISSKSDDILARRTGRRVLQIQSNSLFTLQEHFPRNLTSLLCFRCSTTPFARLALDVHARFHRRVAADLETLRLRNFNPQSFVLRDGDLVEHCDLGNLVWSRISDGARPREDICRFLGEETALTTMNDGSRIADGNAGIDTK